MKAIHLSLCLAIAAACTLSANQSLATIIDDFNSGDIVLNFEFDDDAGTQIPSLVNSGSEGGSFDTDSDNDDVVANGSGQLDASGKANTSFGSNYVDTSGRDSGRVIALYDVSWAFDETVYDSSQDEEFRLTLIRSDPRSTFVTAEIFFRRTSETEVTLFGNGTGTGATDTDDIILGSSGSPLTILDVDLDANAFDLYTSADGGASFVLAGSGTTDPSRGIESVRLVLNEDFSDDTLLIERFAVSYVPEPATALLAGLATLAMVGRRRG